MVIYLFVEGRTEIALKELLTRALPQLRDRGVSLEIRQVRGKERLIKEARALVSNALAKGAGWVFALVDLYPGDAGSDDAKKRLTEAVRPEDRAQFRPHVAVHDVEAWMLASWDALCQVAACSGMKSKHPSPENVDLTNPPKHHVNELFHRHKKRGYQAAGDGKKVFELADAEEIAAKCPHFKAFRDDLEQCASVEVQ